MYRLRERWGCVGEWSCGVAGAASAPLSPALAGVSTMLLLSLCFVFVAVWAPLTEAPDDPACYDLPPITWVHSQVHCTIVRHIMGYMEWRITCVSKCHYHELPYWPLLLRVDEIASARRVSLEIRLAVRDSSNVTSTRVSWLIRD